MESAEPRGARRRARAAAAAAERTPAARKDDPARLKPAVAFADAKGTLELPAAGQC